MKLWLFVSFPSLLLDRLQRGESDPPPRVLLDPKTHQACQLNSAASAAGMRAGMSLATLLALSDQVDIQLYDAERELRILRELADCCYDFAARLVLRPPAGLVLEVSSMLRLFGDLPAYTSQLDLALQLHGVALQMACAETPLAAEVLARAGRTLISSDAEQIQQALEQLPLARCGLSEPLTRKLQGMGIFHLQQLLNLPRAEVRRRMGSELALWLGQLQGDLPTPTDFYQPPERFQRHLELPFEVQQIAGLLFPLKRLLSEMETFLCRRQCQLQQLQLILRHRDRPDSEIDIAAATPEYRAGEWLLLIQYQLEKVQLVAPVLEIQLLGQQLLAIEPVKEDLFNDGIDRARSSQVLLGRLVAKLGRRQVTGIIERDEHRPECSWQFCPPGELGEPVSRTTDPRPLWLLPAPKPLAEPVSILRGPERIACGWWDGDEVQRDYFLAQEKMAQEKAAQQAVAAGKRAQDDGSPAAETSVLSAVSATEPQGRLCWVFRDAKGNWFLHGWFG